MAIPHQTATSHIPDGRVAATYQIAVAGYAKPWHEHEEFMFLLPSRGALTVSAESSKSQRVGRGLLAVVAPKRFHETVSSDGEHVHTAVYVERDFVSFCARKGAVSLQSGDAPRYCPPTPALLGALHLHQLLVASPGVGEQQRYQRNLIDRLVASACVEAVLMAGTGAGHAARQAAGDARANLVVEIKSYIDATLAQRMDIDAIALVFGTSRRHLTRIFREATGQSITEYQTRQRIVRAAALLQVPGTSVLSAAMSVGIDSPSYLARLFSKNGMPLPHAFKA